MIHPIALLYLLLRMLRAAHGLHTSPDGYARGLSGELRRRRHRARRVRRYAERVPFALAEYSVPPWVPAPRRPVDAAGQADAVSSVGSVPAKTKDMAGASAEIGAVDSAANVSVPAAIVRGRCFMSGRETGARPAESRKLALAVLCALADQAQTRACANAPDEGIAFGESFALGQSRQSPFAGPFRSTGAFKRAELAVLAGGEVA